MKYERTYSSGKQLTKDPAHKQVFGVCAGIAKYYRWPRIAVRVLTIIAALNFPLLVCVAYLVAAAVMPSREQ